MEEQNLLKELVMIVGEEAVLTKEPMSKHTTFRVGGEADYFVRPAAAEELAQIIKLCKKRQLPFYIVGNGSNLLVSDNGFRGVIIQLAKNFSGYEFLHTGNASAVDKENVVCVRVQAGTMLGYLGNELAGYSLSGFEFASGIPGTIGGAIIMNAGAYGGEMRDIVRSVTMMDMDGNIMQYSCDEMEFGYRTSIAAVKGYIVLEAVLEFKPSEKTEILNKMQELAASRKEKQPLEYPSAGSTFKRPKGYFAGKLISDAGLKGFQIGGAKVSEKHAGFVINAGNATAQEIIELTEQVKEKVKAQFDVTLELEVKKLGF